MIGAYGYDRLDNLTVVTDTLGITTTMQYDMFGRKETMQNPDMGDWSYAYDALGNLLTQTDAKSQVIGFAYDGLNRLVEKDYGDPLVTKYFFFGGKRVAMDPEGMGPQIAADCQPVMVAQRGS